MHEKEIASFWPITFAHCGDNALITGSTNRSESRFLFSDEAGKSYIAEGYSLFKKPFQIRQNQLLEFFAANALECVHPFCRTVSGEHGAEFGGLFWQIRPYIPAEKVQRSAWAEEAEYGILWAEFLLQIKDALAAASDPPPMPNAPFYMSNFLPDLFGHAERKMPSIISELNAITNLLAPFFKWERRAASQFAHGDYHPGNILTGNGSIRAVIDWEFAGLKFSGYDMALLIGCLGMDHPKNLSSPSVIALQNTLYRNDFMPEEAWEYLPQMIAATRLGWLGEWLTISDTTLINQEIKLISLLLKN